MATGYADFEFGLVWDEAQESFDVSMRFTGSDNVDRSVHPKDTVSVNLSALADLAGDEGGYASRLSECVFGPTEVRRFVNSAMDIAGRVPIHFRLHIDGPTEFHSVRWELLRDPRTGSPLSTSRNVLFSRYLSGADWRPVVDIPSRDLRALIVIAGPSDISDHQPRGRGRLAIVDVADELRRAKAALAPFRPVVLAGRGEATLANTIGKLEEGFDILYLVGHGVQTDDVPMLFMEHPDGTADPVDARRLEERVRNLADPPLVVLLSSCQSAGTGDARHTEDGGALAALGPRLAAAGVPAVVAMQGNVTVTTASLFGPAFFEAFARDAVVDRAMAVARDQVRDRRDWWVPVLFSRLRSGRLYYEPQFTERAEATWQILDTMMDTGNFTPMLGPGLADGILGSREELARRWARRWQMPIAAHVRGNLAQVAQYLRVTHNPAMVAGQLQKYLRTEMRERKASARDDDPFRDLPESAVERDKTEEIIVEVGRRLRAADPGDPFRVAAAMPVNVFITTGWTDLLQAALLDTEGGKKPQTLCFPWTPRVSWDRWDDPATVEPPTVDRPWVYHLFGRLEDPRSLVLTEDDYFDWLDAWLTKKDIKEIVPPAVKGALTENSLLFLGYRLDDWDFRVVFQSIRSFNLKNRYNDHVGVQLRPESQTIEREAAQRYLESYFGDDKVSIFWADTRTFLDELCQRTGLEP